MRETYDAVAGEYARLLPDVPAEAVLDRALLSAFVDLVRQAGDGPVLEAGCGTGRVVQHLADLGLDVLGVDSSPGMLAAGRAARPWLRLAAGDLRALPVRTASVAGVVAWYSLIDLDPAGLAVALGELARVARPGAPLVLAFQLGTGEREDRASSYGLPVPVTYWWHDPDVVADGLRAHGVVVHASTRREPSQWFETRAQAFLLGHRS